MNRQFKFIIFTLTVLTLLTVNSSAAFAMEEGNNLSNYQQRLEERQAIIEEKQNALQQRIAEYEEKERVRCENINSNVERIIANYDEKVNRNIEVYQNIVNKVQNAVNKIKEKGVDVTVIEGQLATLNQMIISMHQNRETYINTLRDSQNYVCGESEGEFKARIQTARENLGFVKQNATEIRNYIQNTIRPELLRLREELQNSEV